MGGQLLFGRWPRAEGGAAEPLTWTVLRELADGGRLVITRDIIERLPYTERNRSTTWAECDLRAWLADVFLRTAFSEDERCAIAQTSLVTPDNPESGTRGGPPTLDFVFLLSRDEAASMFESEGARMSTATPRAEAQGCCSNWWWLRSPGEYQSGPDVVLGDGRIYNCSGHYNRNLVGIRPALVLKGNGA